MIVRGTWKKHEMRKNTLGCKLHPVVGSGKLLNYPMCSNVGSNMLPHDSINSNTFWTAVEFFDGSTIVDPVVVSDVFWTRLQTNILSVLIGQLLAAVVFSFLLSLVSSQVTTFANFVSEQVFPSSVNRSPGQKLIIPRSIQERNENVFHQPDFGKLLVCVAIDVIGSSSVLLPLFGDVSDILWAPTAGILLRYLFNGSNILFVLEFTEEILPLTDILPLATLCWVIDTFFRDSNLAKLLQLGEYTSSAIKINDRIETIDVDPIEVTGSNARGK
jgi:hypothetical protein